MMLLSSPLMRCANAAVEAPSNSTATAAVGIMDWTEHFMI
jgi:hypothetical protein